jgi:hypothetical protein
MPAGRWRRAFGAALVADLTIEGVVTHMLAEIEHPVAVLVGIGVARFAAGRRSGSASTPAPPDGLTS